MYAIQGFGLDFIDYVENLLAMAYVSFEFYGSNYSIVLGRV